MLLASALLTSYPATAVAAHAEPFLLPVVLPSDPTLVRFTGTLGPVNEDAGSLATLRVATNTTEWLLTLQDVDTLTYTTNPDWMILNDIFSPTLQLKGPERLLHAVDTAARTGMPIRMRGRLYLTNDTFVVTSITPVRPPA
jgi:hypothetical protein